MNGYVKLHRKILQHWIQPKKPFSKFEAWIWIILHVQGDPEENKVMIKGHLYTVERGQSIRSVKSWARDFGWGRKKTDLFLKCLENDLMVDLKRDTRTTQLTVLNYDAYNPLGKTKGKQKENKRKTDATQTQTDNEVNEVNKANEVKKKLHKENVLLTESEYQKLIETYGQEKTERTILAMDNYLDDPKNKYKSHYKALCVWMNRDKKDDVWEIR